MYPHPFEVDKDIFLITREELELILLNSGISLTNLDDVISSYEKDSNELKDISEEEYGFIFCVT